MSIPGRKVFRSWMFIYVGLMAAMALASDPIDDGAKSIIDFPAPKIIAETNLYRRDF